MWEFALRPVIFTGVTPYVKSVPFGVGVYQALGQSKNLTVNPFRNIIGSKVRYMDEFQARVVLLVKQCLVKMS